MYPDWRSINEITQAIDRAVQRGHCIYWHPSGSDARYLLAEVLELRDRQRLNIWIETDDSGNLAIGG